MYLVPCVGIFSPCCWTYFCLIRSVVYLLFVRFELFFVACAFNGSTCIGTYLLRLFISYSSRHSLKFPQNSSQKTHSSCRERLHSYIKINFIPLFFYLSTFSFRFFFFKNLCFKIWMYQYIMEIRKLFWESIDFKHSIYPFSHIK